jgi:hypothetical protein
MTTTEQILAAALGLPAEERMRLVDALVQSLDEDDGSISEAERELLDLRPGSVCTPCRRVLTVSG